MVTFNFWFNRNDSESSIRSKVYENIVARFQGAQLEFGSYSNGGRMQEPE